MVSVKMTEIINQQRKIKIETKDFQTFLETAIKQIAADKTCTVAFISDNKMRELNRDFAGFSRRKMVKKVGLASMIALSIVSSVVAPSAILVASCFTSGNPAPGIISDCSGSVSGCIEFVTLTTVGNAVVCRLKPAAK